MDAYSPQLIQAAKLIAVPLPFALAGYSFAFSQTAVPLLYDQKAEFSVPTVVGIYQNGTSVMMPGTILASAAAAYLAYIHPAQRNIWATAAVSAILPGLWTNLVMYPSNIKRLIAINGSKAAQEKATVSLEARQLLKKWVFQNYFRVGFLVVSIQAAWALSIFTDPSLGCWLCGAAGECQCIDVPRDVPQGEEWCWSSERCFPSRFVR